MEDKTEKIIHDKISRLEKRQDKFEEKIETLDDKLDSVDAKHNDRHVEQIRITTELQGTSRMTMEATNRMADSIEGLVSELKESNSRTDERFNQITQEVRDVRTKIDDHEDARKIKLEEKKLSNGIIIALISGGFVCVQLLVNVISPLFFG